MEETIRCPWCTKSELETRYHDEEWGVPVFEDAKLFEFIILDGFQAGLSWKTILDKRENFRKALFQFDPVILSSLGPDMVEEWMQNTGIIRNRLKLEGVIKNARAFLKTQAEFGSFSHYIWGFVQHKPLVNQWENHSGMPASSPEAEHMSKDMKKRGFTFCGPTICYAFMQAAGLVNDHLVSCHRYYAVQEAVRG